MSPLFLLPCVILGNDTYTDFQIGGTVADVESATPIQAHISVHDEAGNTLGEAQSDDTGRFDLNIVAVADERVSLRAVAAGYYTAWVDALLGGLGDADVRLAYMAICRPVDKEAAEQHAIGPFNKVLAEPALPDDRASSGLVLGEMMKALANDTTGYVVPLLAAGSCQSKYDGYLDRCADVADSIPVAATLTSVVPVATFVRVEAYPLSRCVPKADHAPPLRVDVSLSSGGRPQTETIPVAFGNPHWLPVLLSEKAELPGGKWADHVRVEVAASAWDGQIPEGCTIDLRVWPNYPNINAAEAELLLADIGNEVEYKQRMLDYAQAVVAAAPALRLIEAQATTLLAALATGVDEQLRESSAEMIAALESALIAVFQLGTVDGSNSEATEAAILELIAILDQIDQNHTWTDEHGNPLTIRQLLGEQDASYVETFSQRVGDLADQAEQDVAALPGELADLNIAHSTALAELKPTVFERDRNIPLWDGIVVADGEVRSVGSTTFVSYLLEHAYGATYLLKDATAPELARAGQLRVHGPLVGNHIAVEAYDCLDAASADFSWLYGNVESTSTGSALRACDGTHVPLVSGSSRIADGSLVRLKGRWSNGAFDVSLWGLLRSAR